MLSNTEIQQIKAAHPLEAIVRQHVELRSIAGELHGPCPLNCAGGDDRFILWPDENRYYCRRCEAKGDTFDFLKAKQGLGFAEALAFLGEGDSTTAVSFPPSPPPLKPKAPERSDPFDEIPDLERRSLIENWMQELDEGEGNTAEVFEPPFETPLKWLYAWRNLEPRAIEKFGLGFNPEPFELCGRSVPAGITIPLTSGQEIVGFKIRTYEPEAPKYWRMGKGSYCLNKDSLKQHRQVIVTEGELDCILLDQIVGDRFAVITFGGVSDIAKADLPVLLFNAQSVFWAFDGDSAGYTAAKKYDRTNERYRKLVMPEGEDVSSYFLKTGTNPFIEWLESSMQGEGE